MSSLSEKILITGGLGYLGGRLSKQLATSSGLSLRLMTRRTDEGIPAWAEGFDLVRANLQDASTLGGVLKDIDTVIHLAAADENESQQDPERALDITGSGTYRLLQTCQSAGVKRFIYMSTFHVYGPGSTQPITENSATRPVHPYAITHRFAEDLVNWYRHSFEMKTLVLRLSNGYGSPADSLVQRWTLVFNDLCKQAVQKRAITLRSSGTQHRDFISLNNVGRAVQHFLALPDDEWRDGLFNLGGDCSMSILQVAEKVSAEFAKSYGQDIPLTTGGPAEGEPPSPVKFSIEKLKASGFTLEDNLSEEISATFDLCESLGNQSNETSS